MTQYSMNQQTIPQVPARKSLFRKKTFLFFALLLSLVLALAYWLNVKDLFVNKTSAAGNEDIPAEISVKPVEPSMSYLVAMDHMRNGDSSGKWANKSEPNPGSILPYKRVIAFYGNFYSKNMGILGELPKKEVLKKLQEEVKLWSEADSLLEVQPALHYIAVTAQSLPGKGMKYRLRMPFAQIDSLLEMAARINAIVFLDIQVGWSRLQDEIPELEKYLKLPNVHLGIDPEFAMKAGKKPGSVIGEFDAADINYASAYLEKIVRENKLTPKILVVHRFTQGMVKNYKQIKSTPDVQIVMHMDGWGIPAKKVNTYKQFIYGEPVDYTGFKLFYKNDTKNNGRLLTRQELLKLKPQPVYIQYQ